ncbi:MAG: hypothetical protein JNM69_38735, partial [Archangium sp.]|nr:hypothetical protein [Archangium sp.]
MTALLLGLLSVCPSGDGGGIGLFSLVEVTEDGASTAWPEASVVSVDINSSVQVCLNQSALRSFGHSAAPASDLGERLKLARKTIDALREGATSMTGALQLTAQAKGPLTPDQLAKYRAAAEKLHAATNAIDAYVRTTRGQQGEALLESLDDTPGGIQSSGVVWLAAEVQLLERQLREREAAGSANLELTAFVGDPLVQVHLAGYDDLAPGAPKPVQKTRFVFDENLQREFDEASKLAGSIREYSDARAALERLVATLLERLKAAVAQLSSAASALSGHSVSAVAAVKTTADQLVAEVKALVAQVNTIIGVVTAPGPSETPPEVLRKTLGELSKMVGQVQTVFVKATAFIEAAAAAGASVVEDARVIKDRLEVIQAVVGSARSDVVLPPVQAIAVPLAISKDTELSLVTTSRKDGDLVVIRARVIGADQRVLPGGEFQRMLRVETRGVVADVGATVHMARPLPSSDPFVFAAGSYAVLRFMGWRKAGDAGSP